MNEKFKKISKVEQLTKMVFSHGEEKGLIVKDPFLIFKLYLTLRKYNEFLFTLYQKCQDLCVHSCVTSCVETRIEQALWRYSQKMCFENSSKSALLAIIKTCLTCRFTCHFTSKFQDVENDRDGINKKSKFQIQFEVHCRCSILDNVLSKIKFDEYQ